jgi:hypothetical protein
MAMLCGCAVAGTSPRSSRPSPDRSAQHPGPRTTSRPTRAQTYSCTAFDPLDGRLCFRTEKACLSVRDERMVAQPGWGPCEPTRLATLACLAYGGGRLCLDTMAACNRWRDEKLRRGATDVAPCVASSRYPAPDIDVHCSTAEVVGATVCFHSFAVCERLRESLAAGHPAERFSECRRGIAYCTYNASASLVFQVECAPTLGACEEIHAERGGDWTTCRREGTR